MISDINVQKNKRLRGDILRLLFDARPGTIELRTLTNLLLDNGMITTPDIAPYIDCLADKGYVTVITPEESKRLLRGSVFDTSTFVKLTAHGVDLMERTRPAHDWASCICRPS